MALRDAVRGTLQHPMRAYYLPIAAGVVLGSSAFMPWIAVGERGLGGVPELAGLLVLGLAILAVVLAGISILTSKNSRHPLLLVGLFAFGFLLVAERFLERTAALQSRATADARAIVGGGTVAPALEPVMATGAYLGLAGATLIALFGLTVVFKRAPQIYAQADDDDV